MNEILGKLNEYLEAAEGLVTEYADDAAQLLLHVVQLEAIFYLVLGGGFVVFATYMIKIGKRFVNYNALKYEDRGKELGLNPDMDYEFIGIGLLIGASIPIVVALIMLLDFYNWLAAFNPLAGLVYKLIN